MIYFTKYAEKKLDILNKYKVFFRREQIEEAILKPDQVKKKGNYLAAKKENIKVVYNKQVGVIRVITFYPVKK